MRLSGFLGLARATLMTIVLIIPAVCAAQTYTITDLGIDTGARGINASGQVTGYASAANPATSYVFLYSNGKMFNLGTLGGTNGIGLAINTAGEIAGYSTLSSGGYRGFYFANGKMTSVGTLAGDYSDAEGINDAGQVVGASSTADGETHPYLFSKGKMIDLGTLGGHSTAQWNTAEGVNNAGEVVGWTWTTQGEFRGFLWSKGHMTDLGTLGGAYSQAYAINDAGQITGQSYTGRQLNDYADAFIDEGGTMQDLGTIEGQFSYGFGINNFGVVVGESTYNVTTTGTHAFVYSNGKLHDLNKLIPAQSGWVLNTAYSINDAGQIVGFGNINNQEHGFLLTPQ